MALSPTKITPVLDANCLNSANAASEVFPPLATTTTLANDVGAGEQILRNQTHTLNELKANLSGATFTGLVTVTQGTANTSAIVTTANGTGYGINATGGATGGGALLTAGGGNNIGAYGLGRGTQPGIQGLGGNTGPGGNFTAGGGNAAGVTSTGDGSGSGVSATGGATGKGGTFVAGGGNADGLSATGNGTGAGVSCTGGATGPGLSATPGTASIAAIPQCAAKFAGYIEITADEPSQGVTPAANFPIYGPNIAKAACTVEVDGASGPYTKQFAFNVSVVDDVSSGVYSVVFQRALKDANYSVTFGTDTIGLNAACTSRTASGFEFTVYDTSTKMASASTVTVDFNLFGLR